LYRQIVPSDIWGFKIVPGLLVEIRIGSKELAPGHTSVGVTAEVVGYVETAEEPPTREL